jgi:bifunctional DNase/RNase
LQKVKLDVVGLTSGQTQGSYTLILGEDDGKRKLAIIIGSFEAQAIAIEIEKIVPFRPMTHDLFVSFARSFKIIVREIFIHNLVDGVFYSKIVCEKDGDVKEIDARTSDAISLAVRFKCAIFTTEEIMEQAGHEINIEEESDEDENEEMDEEAISDVGVEQLLGNDLPGMSEEELNVILEEALREEDYQRAASIRDELNKRK